MELPDSSSPIPVRVAVAVVELTKWSLETTMGEFGVRERIVFLDVNGVSPMASLEVGA